MSDKQRLLLAIGLSMAILIFWQILWGPKDQAPDSTPSDSQTQSAAEQTTPESKATAKVDSEHQDAQKVIKPQSLDLTTQHFSLELTNVGARALHHHLYLPERYQEHGDWLKTLQTDEKMFNPHLPFGLELSSKDWKLTETDLFEASSDSNKVKHFVWTDPNGLVRIQKSYQSTSDPYTLLLKVEVHNLAPKPMHAKMALKIYGRQDPDKKPSFFEPVAPVEAVCFTDGDTERIKASDDTESYDQNVQWVSIDALNYVIGAAPSEFSLQSCTLRGIDDFVQASISHDITVEPNGTKTWTYRLYMGPKEQAFLATFGQDLDRTIDYGWVEVLSRPLHWLLVTLFHFFGNWGMAIMTLTVLIRGSLWPITQKSQDSMIRMRDLNPKLKELQEKYKDQPAVLQQKQMELFKEHNVSPFGCLPMFLQIPIWFALYRTIYASAELYQAPFLWIKDLSVPDPYFILPVVVGTLFFIQQKFNSTPTSDVKQKVMMNVVTGMFVIFMFLWPAGLNLYILISTLIGLAQAFYAQKKQKALKRASTHDSAPLNKEGKLSRAEARRQARQKQKSKV